MSPLHGESELSPTLLTLPTEIRAILLRDVFSSRIIRFAVSPANSLEETERFSKIYHEWHLGFLSASRQLCDEGRIALRSAISESTLVLHGLLPDSDVRRDKLDRYLYTRRMLKLFIKQYGDEVRTLKLTNAPSPNLNLDYFRGLVRLTLQIKLVNAFDVFFPPSANSNTLLMMRFEEFEKRSTDEQVQDAIIRRWKDLKSMRPFEGLGSTMVALKKMIAETSEMDRLQFTLILQLTPVYATEPDLWSSKWPKLVIDGKTDEVLDFSRRLVLES